jgi:hypothetical protein
MPPSKEANSLILPDPVQGEGHHNLPGGHAVKEVYEGGDAPALRLGQPGEQRRHRSGEDFARVCAPRARMARPRAVKRRADDAVAVSKRANASRSAAMNSCGVSAPEEARGARLNQSQKASNSSSG